MDATTLTLIVVSALCFLLYRWKKGRSVRLPPPMPKLAENKKSFIDTTGDGDVYSLSKLGPVRQISLNSYRAVQEALVGQPDVFSGRGKGALKEAFSHNSGVVQTDGPKWQEHRRFVMRLLRDFGMGRPQIQNIILDETAALKETIDQAQGRPMTSQEIFSSLTSNVIARLMFGERTGTSDEQFKEFCQHIKATFKFRPIMLIPMVFPFLLKIPGFLKFFDRFADLFWHHDAMHAYIRGKIAQQAEALRAAAEPLTDVSQANTVCEAYLIEQARQEAVSPGQHTFTEQQVVQTMTDLFTAGTETSASTLNWAMLLLAINPDVQARVQTEIKDKLGRSRVPEFADRHSLPYVSAVIDEIMRFGTLTPIGIQHRVTRDTELLGYEIPEDTLVWINVWGIHTDPRHWARPHQMYPEHFLTPDGEYKPSPHLLTFSAGKRACLGESLARMEIFLILTSIMQSFSVRLADPSADVEKLVAGIPGIIRHPGAHQVCFDRLEE